MSANFLLEKNPTQEFAMCLLKDNRIQMGFYRVIMTPIWIRMGGLSKIWGILFGGGVCQRINNDDPQTKRGGNKQTTNNDQLHST